MHTTDSNLLYPKSSVHFLKNIHFFCSILLLFAVFCNYLSKSLLKGGRWGIGNIMAVAERFENTGIISYESTEELLTTAHYFPGGVYVSIIANTLTHQFREEFVILVSVLFVVFFILLSVIFFKQSKLSLFPSILISTLLVTHFFNSFLFYAGEMHPDMPCVFFAFAAVIMIAKLEESTTHTQLYLYVLSASFFLVCSGLFKQTAVFFFLGIAVYFWFYKKYSLRKKFLISVILVISGMIVLAQILLIPGCFFETVSLFARQYYISPGEFLAYVKHAFSDTWLMVELLLLYYFLLVTKKISLSSTVEKLYFVCAHIWAAATFLSTMKKGGDDGNIEVALWALLPFAIQGGIWLWNICQKTVIEAYPEYPKTVISFLIFLSLAASTILTSQNLRGAATWWPEYVSRRADQKQACLFWDKKFAEKKVAVATLLYFYYADSKIRQSTDFYLCEEYHCAGLLPEKRLYDLSRKKQWDVILLPNKDFPKLYRKVFEDYQIYKDPCLTLPYDGLVYVRKSRSSH